MLISTLYGSKGAEQEHDIMTQTLSLMNGDYNYSRMFSDLKSLKERIHNAFKLYSSGEEAFNVPLTEEEKNRYEDYGLSAVDLERISIEQRAMPASSAGSDVIGIEEADREFIGRDYENSSKTTSANRLLDQINVLLTSTPMEDYKGYEETYIKQDAKPKSNNALIIGIIALAVAVLYIEYGKRK